MWGGGSWVGSVDARMIACFGNALALSAAVREIPSVKIAVEVGAVGIVVGRQGRDRVGSESWVFGSWSG